jgi:hypothetical protein
VLWSIKRPKRPGLHVGGLQPWEAHEHHLHQDAALKAASLRLAMPAFDPDMPSYMRPTVNSVTRVAFSHTPHTMSILCKIACASSYHLYQPTMIESHVSDEPGFLMPQLTGSKSIECLC